MEKRIRRGKGGGRVKRRDRGGQRKNRGGREYPVRGKASYYAISKAPVKKSGVLQKVRKKIGAVKRIGKV